MSKKIQIDGPAAIFLASQLRDGVKLLYDSCKLAGAPSGVRLTLADALSSLDSVLTIFKVTCYGKD